MKTEVISKLAKIISTMGERIRDDWSDPREELKIIKEAASHILESTGQIDVGYGWRIGVSWIPNAADPTSGQWVQDNHPRTAESFILFVEDGYEIDL